MLCVLLTFEVGWCYEVWVRPRRMHKSCPKQWRRKSG